jgi:hypothetical protein
MLLILLFSSTLSQAFGEINHYLYLKGFTIEVEAPDEAKAGEDFNVKLTIDIDPLYSEIYINSMIVSFGPSYNPFYKEVWFYHQGISEDFSKTYSLKTKDYGRVLCIIKISYVIDKGTSYEENYEEDFWLDLTYVTYKTREELEDDYYNISFKYNSLSYEYDSLKKDYDKLVSEYEKLENDYYNLSSRYRNLDNKYTLLKSDYDNLGGKYESLEEDYNNLSEKLQEQNKMINVFFLTTIVFLASTFVSATYLTWKIKKIRKEQRK